MVTGCCGIGCGELSNLRRFVPSVTTRSVSGSGKLVTREMDLDGFTKLNLSHAFNVSLTQSDQYRVSLTVDDNVWDLVQVSQSRGVLYLGLESQPFSMTNVTLQAEVSMPSLEATELSGATSLRGEIDTGNVSLEVSGASNVSLRGSGRDLTVRASGASDVDLREFVVQNAQVEASGASEVTVHVTGRLDAEASGASRVRYLGNPGLGRIDSTGASSVSPLR
jgi:hypothetical protein